MARHSCEVFGLVRYPSDLSYHGLYDLESQLMERIQAVLDDVDADHIDFWGDGDALQYQCALQEYDEDSLDGLREGVAEVLRDDLQARLVTVDKPSAWARVYEFSAGEWDLVCGD